MKELVENEQAYRHLPAFLFEKQFHDMRAVIEHVYGALFKRKESFILAIRDNENDGSCGLAELYGLRDGVHKISIGYRLLERYWGRGIATQVVSLMVGYLRDNTDIEIITASTTVDNLASASVLEKNDFIRTARSVEEHWGFETPAIAYKWFY